MDHLVSSHMGYNWRGRNFESDVNWEVNESNQVIETKLGVAMLVS